MDREHTSPQRRGWRKPSVLWAYVFIAAGVSTIVLPAASEQEETIRLACTVVAASSPDIASNSSSTIAGTYYPLSSSHQAGNAWDHTPASLVSGQPDVSFLHTASPPDIDLDACKRNVGVQRLIAHINMISQIGGGILGALMTAAMSTLSDRAGRCKVLALGMLAITVRQLCFLLVCLHPQSMVRTGGAVLCIGPMLEGLLGGTPLFNAVLAAYITDVISVDKLPMYLVGVMVISSAVMMTVPLVGPFLVEETGNRLIPFEVTLVLQAMLILFIILALPESLAKEDRDAAKRAAATAPVAADDVSSIPAGMARRVLRRTFSPLKSLAVFLPRSRGPGRPKDWNLFCLAIVIFLLGLAREESPEVQYVVFAFGWGQNELARRLSLMAVWRLVTVASIVPFYTFVLKPYIVNRFIRANTREMRGEPAPPTEQTPLLSTQVGVEQASESSAGPSTSETESSTERQAARVKTQSDRAFMGACILIESSGFLIKGFNITGSVGQYVAGTAVALVGGCEGFIQAPLLVELNSERNTGRLFGARAVISALGATFFSPLLFNTVLKATIGSYAPTIFLVAAALYLMSFVSVAFIRVRPVGKTVSASC